MTDMHMGFVFDLGSFGTLSPEITRFMVRNFVYDANSGLLKLGKGFRRDVNLKEYFRDCYSLPFGGKTLEHDGDFERGKQKDVKDYAKNTGFSELVNMRMNALWDKVTCKDTSVEDFPIYFMTAILNAFLACSRHGNTVDTSFLQDLLDSEIKDLDWCGFLTTYLVKSIEKFKRNKLKNCPGCLHILHLICVDYMDLDVEPPPVGFPRVKYIKDVHLNHVAEALPFISLEAGKSADHVRVQSTNSIPQQYSERTKIKSLIKQLLDDYDDYSQHIGNAPSPSSARTYSNDTRKAPNKALPVDGGSKFKAVVPVCRRRSVKNAHGYCFSICRHKYNRTLLDKYEGTYGNYVLGGENSGNPKVQIHDALVTEEEFVNSLKETGEVTDGFMNFVLKTMIFDWKSQNKFDSLIIDPPTVVKILDDKCADGFIDDYLRKEVAKIELLERIYILLKNDSHWVLCIMSLFGRKLFLFCPTLNPLQRREQHGKVIQIVVDRLKSSLVRLNSEYVTKAAGTKKASRSPSLLFGLEKDTFHMIFPDESKVDIKNAGVGIYFLILIEEHNGFEIKECELTHGTLFVEKKRLADTLVFHWWNIFHPSLVEPERNGANKNSLEIKQKKRRKNAK